jgi:putative oxidoreductase
MFRLPASSAPVEHEGGLTVVHHEDHDHTVARRRGRCRPSPKLPFLKSGFLKWDGFQPLSGTAVLLFENGFKLHILGRGLFLSGARPHGVAHGFRGSRPVARPPCGSRHAFRGARPPRPDGVIQLVFPEGRANFHLPWAAMLLTLVVFGSGRLSLDWPIARALRV